MNPQHEVNDFTNGSLLNQLITEAQTLSSQLPTIKTLTDKRMVEDYENKVGRKRTELKRADEAIRRRMDELKAMRKLIEITDDVLSSDKSESKAYFWQLHEEEKAAHRPSTLSNI